MEEVVVMEEEEEEEDKVVVVVALRCRLLQPATQRNQVQAQQMQRVSTAVPNIGSEKNTFASTSPSNKPTKRSLKLLQIFIV